MQIKGQLPFALGNVSSVWGCVTYGHKITKAAVLFLQQCLHNLSLNFFPILLLPMLRSYIMAAQPAVIVATGIILFLALLDRLKKSAR